MSEVWRVYSEKFNALSTRERVIIIVSLTAIMLFTWWSYYAQPLLDRSRVLSTQTITLDREIANTSLAMAAINKRIEEGVYKSQQEQLEIRRKELKLVNELLQQKTLDLVEPDEMFALMREMLFADSKLKLTGLKRNKVQPVFNQQEEASGQPRIYRHVMQVGFEGTYVDILNYVNRLEAIEWKLLWDSIRLTVVEYPVIQVSIEISTLSDTEQWVGL